jgi:3-hydroxybutyryl-CoA dehydrogenase
MSKDISARVTETVGVLGAGTMGVGIAIVMLRAGHNVVLKDVTESFARAGAGRIGGYFDRSVKLGKLSEAERDQAMARLTVTSSPDLLAACGVVVEAIVEDVALKRQAFTELDKVCGPDTLFHSNTSTLSVTEIAAGSALPERVVGTHYCNPAPLMKLVEVVRARQSSDAAFGRTVDFVQNLGKTVVTTRDVPGFIVNRFLIPFENDCIRALDAGEGTVQSIDRAVTAGLGYPMGPFTLLDIVGLDVHKLVATSLYEQFHERRFAAPPLVDRMIAEGALGRKSGRGFYDYSDASLFGAS